MALAELVSTLNNLANDVEDNQLSETDVRDRVKMLSESVEELSALTGFDSSGVIFTLEQVLQYLSKASRVGRPAIDIPAEAIEWYLCHDFKIREIAAMYGVCKNTISQQNAATWYQVRRLVLLYVPLQCPVYVKAQIMRIHKDKHDTTTRV